VGSPETTAVKVTGVATGPGDDVEGETVTVIPLTAVCPISANPIAANIRQFRISRIIFLFYKAITSEGATFQNSDNFMRSTRPSMVISRVD
jgi:hypothetical protein